MNDFPELLPWDELSARVKMLIEKNERFEKRVQILEQEQAETKELVYWLEKQIDRLEKVVADLMPEQGGVIVQAVDAPFETPSPLASLDLFQQALSRLTDEQKKLLNEASEDDCIF